MSEQEIPRFAVVGRVNKGKSSIIATLAEDDRVAISPKPGTTRRNTDFPVTVDDQTLFVLVDTPGFEEAPAALAWLKETSPGLDQRRARVEAFVAKHRGTDDFEEECELLQPVLQGSGVLYVVDGTKPYNEGYYASEMEILRWAGQPSMALINRIGEGDYTEDWKNALDQHFKVVRVFDAHTATFEERIRLLTTFRELSDPWRDALSAAIEALQAERSRREAEVIDLVTELLLDALTLTLEAGEKQQAKPELLEEEFHGLLRQREQQARRAVEKLYHHERVDWSHANELARPVFGEDLFAKKTWSTLGLTPAQLVTTLAVSGAVSGGVLDAFVGGASFGTGLVLGGIAGAGAGAWHLQRRFAKAKSVDGLVGRAKKTVSGDTNYRVGPFSNPNFPFVLLDRALLHYDAVRTRAHAKNAAEDSTTLKDAGHLAQSLSKDDRSAMAKVFKSILRDYDDVPGEVQHALREHVGQRIRAMNDSG